MKKLQVLQCKSLGVYEVKQSPPILEVVLEIQSSDRNGTRTDDLDGSPELPRRLRYRNITRT